VPDPNYNSQLNQAPSRNHGNSGAVNSDFDIALL